MKKQVIAFAVAMATMVVAMAQTVQETAVMVGSVKVQAYTMNFERDAKTIQNVVAQRMKEAGLKVKNVEGYQAAEEQMMPEIAPAAVSFYTKVEEQGKKKNKVAVLTVCAMPTDLTADPSAVKNNVRTWIEGMPAYLAKYDAMQNLQAEQANLKKAEKAASAAVSVVSGLEKSIASDQKKIADKKDEIKRLQSKIKECESDIKSLEANIEKNTAKKADAEAKASDANANVKSVQTEVERYRQMTE